LPAGRWIDYQTGRVYDRGWHRIEAGQIPVVMLVRDGTVLPQIGLAQSTAQMDWTKLELVVYATEPAALANGLVCLPSDGQLQKLEVERKATGLMLRSDPFNGRVQWRVR